uniref:Uncharacterized protein n=1 Tax=Oryza punctata TaxID=4537 RepID=A0A0E0KB46_ORYPU
MKDSVKGMVMRIEGNVPIMGNGNGDEFHASQYGLFGTVLAPAPPLLELEFNQIISAPRERSWVELFHKMN